MPDKSPTKWELDGDEDAARAIMGTCTIRRSFRMWMLDLKLARQRLARERRGQLRT
jgi:hypothetical protein